MPICTAPQRSCSASRSMVISRRRMLFDDALQPIHVRLTRRHARHPERHRVAEEDFRKRFADHGAEPFAADRLRRVFPRRPAPEVAVDHEDRGVLEPRVGQRMRHTLRPCLSDVVFEKMPLESLERHGPQEPRRDDAVGIDVIAAQRQPRACDPDNLLNRHSVRNPLRRRPLPPRPRRRPSPDSSTVCARSGCPAGP